jgi:hypothetical protein
VRFGCPIGLVPREDSTGGKLEAWADLETGDQDLRRILVVGAHAVLHRAPAIAEVSLNLVERVKFRRFLAAKPTILRPEWQLPTGAWR